RGRAAAACGRLDRLLRAVHRGGRGGRGGGGPGRRRRLRGRERRQPRAGAGHPAAVRPADRGDQRGRRPARPLTTALGASALWVRSMRGGRAGGYMTAFSRAAGALYGLAVGDALGMPTQSLPREQIATRYGALLDGFEPAAPDHPLAAGMPAGSVTDDTEQALPIARLLLDGGGRGAPAGPAR